MTTVLNQTELIWHDHRYFPYERELARWEAATLLAPLAVRESLRGLIIDGSADPRQLERLVYVRSYAGELTGGDTIQRRLEASCSVTGHQRKQSTRYAVHGLHEYHGKFNPQVVRGILNALGIKAGQQVLDPFCGSGTSLVECAIGGITGQGTDINPLAVYVSNAKLTALQTPAADLAAAFATIIHSLTQSPPPLPAVVDERLLYLQDWFAPDILLVLEAVRAQAQQLPASLAHVVLALLSDVLRAYSGQEPADLRIRRRRTPLPTVPLVDAMREKLAYFLANVQAAQAVIGVPQTAGAAHLHDNRQASPLPVAGFDAAITSPPYATALPYIDTQRLSLVWVGLCTPSQLRRLEADLTGSREFIGRPRREWNERLHTNADALPPDSITLCRQLAAAVSETDGFRRQAMPALVYRYLVNMRDMFRQVSQALRPGAPFALVVGHNRTTLGGQVFALDTPAMLRHLAEQDGWQHEQSMPLQTYQRYSVHRQNAVQSETLLIVRKPNGI